MPTINWELGKQKFIEIDPAAYAILGRTTDNGKKNEDLIKVMSEAKEDKEKETHLTDSGHAFVRDGLVKLMAPEERCSYWDKKKNDINQRMFFPKYRQTRVGFYQIEQALHFQLREILILETKKDKAKSLEDVQKLIDEYISKEIYEDKDYKPPENYTTPAKLKIAFTSFAGKMNSPASLTTLSGLLVFEGLDPDRW